jgi:hypothetical protein
METDIPVDYIRQVFEQVGAFDTIYKIIELPLRNDSNYKRIIIKLTWNQTTRATELQTLLRDRGEIKLVHSMPWFWKIVVTNGSIL